MPRFDAIIAAGLALYLLAWLLRRRDPRAQKEKFVPLAPDRLTKERIEAALAAIGCRNRRREGDAVLGDLIPNRRTFGERVSVTTANAGVRIRSRCVLPTQIFDWGKNADNLRRLEAALLGD